MQNVTARLCRIKYTSGTAIKTAQIYCSQILEEIDNFPQADTNLCEKSGDF
jgi:hypothetical protein